MENVDLLRLLTLANDINMASILAGYDVLYTIAMGFHGRCQKIRRKSDGKVLVWKEMHYDTLTESETQTLILKLNFLKKLKHPNVVRCYGCIVDSANTKLYIVMEDCTGDTLASLIASASRERRHLDERFILRVIAQLTSALKKFHRKSNGRPGFLHHNLKANNIFLDSEQNVKLGKPSYTSAESDIWSLGCLLYELCTLCRYFPTPDPKVLADKMPAGTLRRVPGQYSEELRMLLNNMLNLTDDPRPSTDSILQSNLLAEAVGEEEKKGQLWLQRRLEKAERNKRVCSSRKNKENLAPGHPQLVMLHNIARRLQTDDRLASRVDKGRCVCGLRF
ncbi:serine/threonine-protein kinase Nek2-like isoform X1 [Hippocampus comes]|uniref:serine/threonine-protein kinase Nek2-like isoform X1 n=1 Tax=Hippocampus comes TaxID=109280 RepID=UPI00094EA59C|nr:PREDICTED: serine/threonine-protein kinase Nek2-like isoform X1 [Hippocampus comes]